MVVKTSFRKIRPTKTPKSPPVCSLGHIGHTDQHCVTRIRAEEKEMMRKYKQLLSKGKVEPVKQASSSLAVTSVKSHVPEPQPSQPSYYDKAFACGFSSHAQLITLDTRATSNMFGN